jgi:selenide, water dikinase
LLVGFETSDDAGVYQLNDDLALVQTVDFLTPIADDPFLYGQIAAANSLSDVYAMGGRPLSALSIVGFPVSGTPEILEQILRGGLSKMDEANCTVVGGHSIRDDELKFGYAVTGLVHPRRIWRNIGARPGDVLFLTKAIGTGVIATALKQGCASSESVEAANHSMMELNRAAADALMELQGPRGSEGPVHAVTDVTGFGLLGHAREMALGSDVSFRIDSSCVEYFPGAREAARAGFFSGGLKNNREFLEGCIGFLDRVSDEYRSLLFDPQTSGGLLVAVAANALQDARRLLSDHGVAARPIGAVFAKRSPLLEVA